MADTRRPIGEVWPVITGDQIIAHLVGDYILQSDWMAREKTRNSFACLLHVVVYSLPFLLITQNPATLAVIAGTHFLIDHWRLTRFVIWVKNIPFPGARPWSECSKTGYPPDLPGHLSRMLYIIVDGTMHVLINGVAIYYLG